MALRKLGAVGGKGTKPKLPTGAGETTPKVTALRSFQHPGALGRGAAASRPPIVPPPGAKPVTEPAPADAFKKGPAGGKVTPLPTMKVRPKGNARKFTVKKVSGAGRKKTGAAGRKGRPPKTLRKAKGT